MYHTFGNNLTFFGILIFFTSIYSFIFILFHPYGLFYNICCKYCLKNYLQENLKILKEIINPPLLINFNKKILLEISPLDFSFSNIFVNKKKNRWKGMFFEGSSIFGNITGYHIPMHCNLLLEKKVTMGRVSMLFICCQKFLTLINLSFRLKFSPQVATSCLPCVLFILMFCHNFYIYK